MDNDKKVLLVDVEEAESASQISSFEIYISQETMENSDISKTSLLVEEIMKIKPSLRELLSTGVISFQRESEMFPGKYVEVGEFSPLKHKDYLKCMVTRKKVKTSQLEGKFVLILIVFIHYIILYAILDPNNNLYPMNHQQINSFNDTIVLSDEHGNTIQLLTNQGGYR